MISLCSSTPPSGQQTVHAIVLDATSDCAAAMEAYRTALATNNAPNDAPLGQALVQRCVTKLEQLWKKELSL
jgi:hypothetical protein